MASISAALSKLPFVTALSSDILNPVGSLSVFTGKIIG
eukprot:CAMPEP_0119117074 /NCGR_PEP_ID=MMETSP1180-20130426/52635_1 /TAXON_ID=3052 ORGANISM="Chlamydomonas cf sp, Strain CCMP681" /NCGR_SAMPLE_ID=MMETSP1180 /ASSEMBLY_ACC=CAM_ASM_000741 /LENGTH=37 /DNA_ID= /DNA_START= /DNA_END= /DNA_ORIENTATION=